MKSQEVLRLLGRDVAWKIIEIGINYKTCEIYHRSEVLLGNMNSNVPWLLVVRKSDRCHGDAHILATVARSLLELCCTVLQSCSVQSNLFKRT